MGVAVAAGAWAGGGSCSGATLGWWVVVGSAMFVTSVPEEVVLEGSREGGRGKGRASGTARLVLIAAKPQAWHLDQVPGLSGTRTHCGNFILIPCVCEVVHTGPVERKRTSSVDQVRLLDPSYILLISTK